MHQNVKHYVSLHAKTNLIAHYNEKIKAIQVGNSQIMNILGKGADDLYERYY